MPNFVEGMEVDASAVGAYIGSCKDEPLRALLVQLRRVLLAGGKPAEGAEQLHELQVKVRCCGAQGPRTRRTGLPPWHWSCPNQ